ncbi:MAG: polysaccharide biosynthesis protein [Thermodesulfobacteriota bacterium]|nr:MAG: polysaccharide biosynthesis protein [Thermodesulfobacteriota bacterium]
MSAETYHKTNIEGGSSYHFFKGRVALYAILNAIGVGADDEVIIPAFTCVVVPNAISYLNAKPVYVDISRSTFNLDPEKLEESITESTKAIIAQHTFGIPADMDKILGIAKKYQLYVIEDSCHAIGSRYRSEEVGTLGDAAFFSSQWSKPITTGLGGWAIVNNKEIGQMMKELYPSFVEPSNKDILLLRFQYLAYSLLLKPSMFWYLQGFYRSLANLGLVIGSSSKEELEHKMSIDYKMKMSDWQKSLLSEKSEEIENVIEHRKWIVSLYEDSLRKRGMEIVQLPKYYDPVFLRYPILVKDKAKTLKEAKKSRVELGDWFVSPVHPNLNGWEKINYQKGMCPTAEYVCNHIINLPTHMRITEQETKRIIQVIERIN